MISKVTSWRNAASRLRLLELVLTHQGAKVVAILSVGPNQDFGGRVHTAKILDWNWNGEGTLLRDLYYWTICIQTQKVQ